MEIIVKVVSGDHMIREWIIPLVDAEQFNLIKNTGTQTELTGGRIYSY